MKFPNDGTKSAALTLKKDMSNDYTVEYGRNLTYLDLNRSNEPLDLSPKFLTNLSYILCLGLEAPPRLNRVKS